MWAVIESPWTLEVTIGNQERISQKNILLLVIVFALISEGVCRSSLFWKNKATYATLQRLCVWILSWAHALEEGVWETALKIMYTGGQKQPPL